MVLGVVKKSWYLAPLKNVVATLGIANIHDDRHNLTATTFLFLFLILFALQLTISRLLETCSDAGAGYGGGGGGSGGSGGGGCGSGGAGGSSGGSGG